MVSRQNKASILLQMWVKGCVYNKENKIPRTYSLIFPLSNLGGAPTSNSYVSSPISLKVSNLGVAPTMNT